jgi:serine phosphatase RsbU (regulator of sigma subunit)
MVSCGHPAPYVIVRDGSRARADLVPPGRYSPPLGLGSVCPADYAVDTFPFASGTTLLLYTDGAIEARDGGGRFYDLGARVAAWRGTDPQDLLEWVVDGLTTHVGGEMRLKDDVALLAIQPSADRVLPAATAGVPIPG